MEVAFTKENSLAHAAHTNTWRKWYFDVMLGVLFVLCLSSCKQRGGKVLRANAIAARASNKLFQLMACKYDCCTCKHLLVQSESGQITGVRWGGLGGERERPYEGKPRRRSSPRKKHHDETNVSWLCRRLAPVPTDPGPHKSVSFAIHFWDHYKDLYNSSLFP